MKIILVVEDEPAIAEVLRHLLEEEGYQIVLASNGQKALDQLGEVRPDLVLSDLMMPMLTGTEMLSMMQSDPVLSQIPVILMSAAGSTPAAIAISGMPNYIGFLKKPFEMDALMLLIMLAIG